MNYECDIVNAPKFADWIKNRGGVAWWRSVDLSNPSASLSTPALTDGRPTPRPTWQADDKPEVVTDPAAIQVYETVVLEKISVSLKASEGMAVLTKGSENRVLKAVTKHRIKLRLGPDDVFYRRSGDLMFPEMEVCQCVPHGTLKDWIAKHDDTK